MLTWKEEKEKEVYEAYNPNRLYDRVNHGLPNGAQVKLPNGVLGHVVGEGDPYRSLVVYTPDILTGCSEARDWFANFLLQVKV